MQDSETLAAREKERLKRLEEQIENMLPNMDYKQLIKELDYNIYSGLEKMDIVQILLRIKAKQAKQDENKKLQKVINQCYRT
jgi:hypothetical protein